MNELDVKKLWQTANESRDDHVVISKKLLRELQSERAYSKIRSFKRNHILVMLLGILWIAILGFLIAHSLDKTYFAISASIILAFNVFAVGLYFKHIIILSGIDMSGSIAQTQQKLVQVYTSYAQSSRILLLQAPFFCTFWYTDELVQHAGPLFWSIQLIIVGFFTGLSIYLFRKLSIHNPSNRWRELSFRLFGAQTLKKALDFLTDLEQ